MYLQCCLLLHAYMSSSRTGNRFGFFEKRDRLRSLYNVSVSGVRLRREFMLYGGESGMDLPEVRPLSS